MRCCVLFLAALFACVLNIVHTTNIIQLEELQPEVLSHIRKRSASSTDGQEKVCFKNYIAKKTDLFQHFQNGMSSCVENFIVEYTPEAQTDCNLDGEKIEDYNACLRDFKAGETHGEVKTTPKDIEKDENDIEEEKQNCIQDSIADAKLKEMTELSQLQQCLFKIASPPLQLRMPPYNYLDEVKNIYKTLKNCSQGNEEGLFYTCLDKSYAHKKVMDYMTENAETFYEELEEFDQKENSCLRHFITKYAHRDFFLQFDLEKCVKEGFDKTANEEVGDTKVINDYGKLRKLLTACRVDLDKPRIEMCIYGTLENSEIVEKIALSSHMMSDSYRHKLGEQIDGIFNNDETCMGYIFDSLQFKGLFMKASAKESLKKCLAQRYIVNSTPAAAQDVITKLRVIEDSLILCVRMAVPEAFLGCVNDNISNHQSSLDYIVTSPLFQKEYIRRINRHDKAKGTCYTKIVYGTKVNFFYPFSKCFGSKIFERSNKVDE